MARYVRRFREWLRSSQPWNRHHPVVECTEYRWNARASEDLDTLWRTGERRLDPSRRSDRGGMGWDDE